MTKRKYKERCYYCGSPACCDEHAPPQMMFDHSCDSITVPSCAEHNNVKGADDQVVINGFLQSLNSGRGRYLFEDRIIQAIDKKLPAFERTKYKAFNTPLLNNSPNLLIGFTTINVDNWMRQLTAALVWDGIRYYEGNIDWSKANVWSPDYYKSNGPVPFEPEDFRPKLLVNLAKEDLYRKLKWESGWSASPRRYPEAIYYFQVHFGQDKLVIFKHGLFNSFRWYVEFTAKETVKTRLQSKLKEWNQGRISQDFGING